MNKKQNNLLGTHMLLVVIYKVRLENSLTIQSIVRFIQDQAEGVASSYQLYIWDNSPDTVASDVEGLRMQLPALDIRYTHTPENCSLSKVYNTVARELADDNYLTLLDQDSILPSEYFIELRKAQLEGYPLILPQVKCGGVLVSPGTRFFCKGKLLKNINPGVTSSKNLLAINSGMSAKCKVFKTIPYDERLMFYGTDTYFMKHYERHFSHAYVIDARLNHLLAENDSATSVERKQQIAQARYDAWKIVFSETLVERLFLWFYQSTLKLRKWLNRK